MPLAFRIVAVAGWQNGCHERQTRFWNPFQESNGAAAGALLARLAREQPRRATPSPQVNPKREDLTQFSQVMGLAFLPCLTGPAICLFLGAAWERILADVGDSVAAAV